MTYNNVIFTADDDEDDRLLLKQAFDQQSPECQLVFFTDGDELLSALMNLPFGELPRLIILDLNMPRMSGFEVLKRLKAHPRLRIIPVVVMTTSNRAEDVALSYQSGSSSFVTKPTSYDRLLELVKVTRQYWFETVTVFSEL
ncbi:Response regulator rcp1 [Fibrisoma limi BUZ 3]|uniref:Response regulator rcp1 n=1 Tax=Fibrisoma limi BUZ 3 TaxID=1185876 RepID=I2GIU0_9BACT|nr:response regulator [Fibrisoma limi]CCH53815.1 Response regulator rcp1 [Fibrisoma limi BUZ 3]